MQRVNRSPLVGLLFIGLGAWMGACDAPSRDAGAFTSAGVAHLEQGDYDNAIRDFDRAIALQPGLVVAWKNRGLAHKGKGDFDRALADYDQALLYAPGDARLYNERGSLHVGMSDYPRAIEDFNRAIALKPDHAPAMKNRGRTNFVLGNFAQAAADLQRGLSLDSADADAALWLHLARRRLAQDDGDDFAAHAAAADTSRWPAPVLHYFLGTLSAEQLRAAAADSTNDPRSDHRCSVSFFLGEDALLRKDRDGAATLFDESRTACTRESTEHKAASAELQRLHPSSAK